MKYSGRERRERERPLSFLRRLGDEEAHGVCRYLGHVGIDADLLVSARLLGLDLYGEEEELELDETQPGDETVRTGGRSQVLLCGLTEGHAGEGGRQGLRVHLTARACSQH